MGETSIPCQEETAERLKALRGGGYKNWDTFLNELADAWEARFDGSGVDDVRGVGVDEDMYEELRRLQELVENAPARTASELEGRMR